MIGSLRGIVLEAVGPSELLVEVGGVGYRVAVPTTAMSGVEVGREVFLYIHTHVREDAIVLYGFTERGGRDCFEGLLAAHGVGPSLALAILSVHAPAALSRAVLSGDAGALTLVPGVGPKTAARLLIDLQPRFCRLGSGGAEEAAAPGAPPGGGALAEVGAALANLGYGPDEVRAAITAVTAGGAGPVAGVGGTGADEGADRPAEDLLRAALKELASARRRVRA